MISFGAKVQPPKKGNLHHSRCKVVLSQNKMSSLKRRSFQPHNTYISLLYLSKSRLPMILFFQLLLQLAAASNAEQASYHLRQQDVELTQVKTRALKGSQPKARVLKDGSKDSRESKSTRDTNESEDSCIDLPDWAMPSDSVWQNSPFVMKTCDELMQIVPKSQPTDIEKFCKFLSQGIYSGPCALEACCFCGGGIARDEFEPRCENMEWNAMKSAGVDLNCEFIDGLPENERNNFCTNFGNATFAEDGLTVNDACCACGGGRRHVNHKFTGRRNLQDENGPGASAAAAAVLPEGQSVVHINYIDNSVPLKGGIPNLEYLGLGYDRIRGNPRGSDSSELDPGFRYRILRLRQDQNNKTVDTSYLVPLGTAVKYTSSCKYDDKSVEVSSESDLRKTMSREAKMDTSASASASYGFQNLVASFSASVSASSSFSQSSKFESKSEENKKISSVSFEARAICSEFEASFIPGYRHELSSEFQMALDNLPVPYNKDNRRHRSVWESFFSAFGTDYVKYLVLGGKRIYSTSMSQQDYSSLVSESIDVSQEMSFEMSTAMGASSQVKAGLVKAAANAAKFLGPKGAAIGSIVNVVAGDVDDDEVLFGSNVEAKSDYSLSMFARNKEQAEAALKISEKKLTHSELTIGGSPNIDWRVWAETVKEKPMPVRYEFGSIMDFMNFEQITAFIAAFQDLYQIDISEELDGPILNGTVHHGVFMGSGEPLSLHNLDPNDDSRVIMQNDVDFIPKSINNTNKYGDTFDENIFFEGMCRDSNNEDYPRNGVWPAPTPTNIKDCLEACRTEYAPSKTPVGVSFDDKADRCNCYWDYRDVPSWGGSLKGTGEVAGGDNSTDLKCYPNLNSGIPNLFLFSDTHKGKVSKPTAIFATQVRGKISVDTKEKDAYPFEYDVVEPWNDKAFFAMTDNINSNGVLTVGSYGGLRDDAIVESSQLPIYSFLSADTLSSYGNQFQSGVLAYHGLMLNEEGKDAFKVISGDGFFKIKFREEVPGEPVYTETPTVIAFPNWFTLRGKFKPRKMADFNSVLVNVTNVGFDIEFRHQDGFDSYLGFNFLVIGPDMPKENIKHGIIDECTEVSSDQDYPKFGIEILNEFECNPAGPWEQTVEKVTDKPKHSGVQIKFDKEFTDIPSVIATPIGWTTMDFGSSDLIARCIVESITRSSAVVKCGIVDEGKTYFPVPFAFIAVGESD